MKKNIDRIEMEKLTVKLIIEMYCKYHHTPKNMVCDECEKLKEYAMNRLEKCMYVRNKPACRNCKTHCYAPSMRNQIIKTMRFAGPRMLYTHPVYTFYYIMRKMLS